MGTHTVIHGDTLSELVEIDIHYYEEGNVRLNWDEKQVKLTLIDASAIVDTIIKKFRR